MARIPLDSDERREIIGVRISRGTGQIPVRSDLELVNPDGSYNTVYGITNSCVNASMVNIKYLNTRLSMLNSSIGTNSIDSDTPAIPTIGDLWFDTSVNLQKVWNGNSWELTIDGVIDAADDVFSNNT